MFVLFGVAAVPLAYVVGRSPSGPRKGLAALGLFVLAVFLFLYLDMMTRVPVQTGP